MGAGRAPGLTYLLRVVPHFAIPSAVVYASFHAAQSFLPIHIPLWVIIPATLFARPVIFFANTYYSEFAHKWAAARQGAVLAPTVQASSFKIIGDIVETLKGGFPAEHFRRWSETYGPTYRMNMLSTTAIFTDDPEFIKTMLATQFDAFEKGPLFREQMESLLGTGVFNADGQMWKFHRSLTRPFFTRERLSDFDIYDRNAETALTLARQRLAQGHSVNFQDLFGRFTLDSATEFLFGHSVDSLSAGLPYPPSLAHLSPTSFNTHPSNTFVDAFTEAQIISARRAGQGPDWALFEFFKDTVKPYRDIMDKFSSPVIQRAVQEWQSKKDKKDEEHNTLLDSLLDQTQGSFCAFLANLLVAGRDTTMALLTFSTYMMAEHPQLEQRLRQEIYEKVGPTGRPTYENMREMRFMRAFLNEVLRLYPSVPINIRMSTRPVVVPSKKPDQPPIYVPAYTTCMYAVVNMHRRTDLWGPDAHTFDPDRFLDERLHKYLTPNPFIFCPFNGGPRICLGQQFAYHEATFLLVRLLQRFKEFKIDKEVTRPPPAAWASAKDRKSVESIHLMSHLTMFVPGGLWLRMKEIQSGDA
ncbi:hypothetical protein NLJ89_g1903 [Agrocybe chaxingu]|uniref:Cytochrome P450 n=1 Tax=Agrocybe chaxingu TaxID=84603 RepID=A0A9W8MZ56_9AGAR|nr:hypothetical protein NLJ89_g1903 [Agrocybe chaxingu]